MQIDFDDYYTETTFWYGTVNKEYDFNVCVHYNNNNKVYAIDSITWIPKVNNIKKTESDEFIRKAETRIINMVENIHSNKMINNNIEDVKNE